MKKIFCLIFLISISQSLFASGGSIYTRFGKGDVMKDYFGRSLALSGAGAALGSEGHISLNNPAGLFRLKLTTFETGFDYTGLDIKGSENSVFYSNTVFSGFVFGFPVDKDLGISAAAGVIPATNVEYEILQNVTNEEFDNYSTSYKGSGGITKLFIGGSYKTPIDFIIGATFDYYTGNIEYSGKIEFDNSSDYRGGTYTNKHGHHGLGTTIGIISPDLSSLFGEESAIGNFRIGTYLNYIAKLNTDTSIISSTLDEDAIVTSGSLTTDYPFTFGIGTGFSINNNSNFYVDYMFMPWTDYKVGKTKATNLQDLHKISAGYEYKNLNARQESFWEQWIFRAGLSYEKSQYLLNGESINVMAISGGFGFPLSDGAYLDIGLSYGKRGTKDKNLFQEDVFKAAFSISFGELWFIREER